MANPIIPKEYKQSLHTKHRSNDWLLKYHIPLVSVTETGGIFPTREKTVASATGWKDAFGTGILPKTLRVTCLLPSFTT